MNTAVERAKQLADQGPSALHFTRMPVRYWDHWFGPTVPHLVVCDQDGHGRTDLTPDADDRAYREAGYNGPLDADNRIPDPDDPRERPALHALAALNEAGR